MGLKATLDTLVNHGLFVAYRPPEVYLLANSPEDLFQIVGGPVWIKGLFQHCITAQTNASTCGMAVNGINMQNAVLNINTVIGGIIIYPLNAAAGSIIIPNVLVNPLPTLAGFLIGSEGQVAGPGGAIEEIVQTISANLDGSIATYVLYYKMAPESLIVLV